jgi:hypothetical protein
MFFCERQPLATVHEFGHVLDGVFLNSIQGHGTPLVPSVQFASDIAEDDRSSSSLLAGWWEAVKASGHYESISKARKQEGVGQPIQKVLDNLLKARELWARCYEMFIARRTSSLQIAGNMAQERGLSAPVGEVTVYNYWQGNDFDEIDVSMSELFERLTWLK